jgi:hypothetical protein
MPKPYNQDKRELARRRAKKFVLFEELFDDIVDAARQMISQLYSAVGENARFRENGFELSKKLQ